MPTVFSLLICLIYFFAPFYGDGKTVKFLNWVISLCINELTLGESRTSVTHVEKNFFSGVISLRIIKLTLEINGISVRPVEKDSLC